MAEVLDLTDPYEAVKIRDEIKTHFQSRPNWVYVRPLGDGENVVAVLVREKSAFVPGRVMVVKRAKGGDAAKQSLQKEIEYLTKLRGSEHIVQMVASRDGTNPRFLSNFLRMFSNATKKYDTPASLPFLGLEGPVLGMEYLQNGTLTQLLNRLREKDLHLPNRVLWSFFLCLVRACVGLSYPATVSSTGGRRLETITKDAPLNFVHGDLHGENVMIGKHNDQLAFPEHALLPPMKLIDLGEASDGGPRAASENINKVSMRLLSLIARRQVGRRERSQYNGYETLATEILPHGNGAKYQSLDPVLRDLLARGVSTDNAKRPGLKELLDAAIAGAKKGAGSYAPNHARESDSAIRDLMQKLLYDANPNEVTV
ncbi:hypothetical protein KJ359_008940 [Pestalotiopsis sp. 9143b]|nr:hypothetical protein KJ359_008940 [Pestalotiopsis sp. 9143b]